MMPTGDDLVSVESHEELAARGRSGLAMLGKKEAVVLAPEKVREMLERATDLLQCDGLETYPQTVDCEIGGFTLLIPKDAPPVAYVADRRNAEFFAHCPVDLPALAASHTALQKRVEELESCAWLTKVIRDICELPDRDSPEGWPEAMLVTAAELETIIRAALSGAREGGGEDAN